MTGTAMTEQEEFYKIYGLEVVAIPTHRPMIRDDDADLVFRTENAKFEALIDEVAEMQAAGRPVLVGTVSVEKSEVLSEMLTRRGVKHEVLNAKFHEKEAPIVAQAGRAGRGDHRHQHGRPRHGHPARRQPAGPGLRDAPPAGHQPRGGASRRSTRRRSTKAKAETAEEHDRVVAAGGLHIIGTERHDARRIDNQLRGRAGRQGDPGSSRFYLSLEDTLMKRFASDRVAGLMERIGLEGDVAIESRLVSKTIENAQSRVEGYNFDIRKRVVEYDDVINKQRETIYAERDKVLRNEDLGGTVLDFVEGELDVLAEQHLGPVIDDWDLEGLARAVAQLGIDGRGPRRRDARRARPTGTQIVERSLEAAEATPGRARSTRYGAQTWAMVERLVLLRVDRPAVGRPPDRAGRLPARRRPAWLRRHGPAGRVQARGVQALRGAARLHPPPGREHHLPGQRPGAARDTAAGPDAADAHARAAGHAARRRRPASRAPRSAPRPPARPAVAAAANGSSPARHAVTSAGESRTTPTAPLDGARAGRRRPRAGSEDLAAVDEVADEDVLPAACGARPAGGRGGRGGLAAAPRRMTLQHGDEAVGHGRRARQLGRPGRQARPQRPVLLRVGPQVQEVPRPLTRR